MRVWIWAISPAHLSPFLQTGTFGVRRVGRKSVEQMAPGDLVFVYLTGAKVIAAMVEVASAPFTDDAPLVPGGAYRHRVRVRPRVMLSPEAYVPYAAFAHELAVAREYGGVFRRVVQQVVHPLPKIDEKVLAFLVRARHATDLDTVLAAYDAYLRARTDEPAEAPEVIAPAAIAEPTERYASRSAGSPPSLPAEPFDRAAETEAVIGWLEAQGYIYAPWLVAAYLTALRTKPLVILAGATGTGKSRLPVLVAEATGGAAHVVPVRPDWTDAGEVLGYTDLHGRFRPGVLLRLAQRAATEPTRQHVAVLDEMNVARVEHYFADVLSRIEQRGGPTGSTPPLLAPSQAAAPWDAVALPANLGLVGTVNVDEAAHAFSRRVLDRAFTLELAEVDLLRGIEPSTATPSELTALAPWPASAWQPRALRLSELLPVCSGAERKRVHQVVAVLDEANRYLVPAGLPVAYRVRDEVAAFVIHAEETPTAFREADGTPVDPLDLALAMKVLPRLEGSGHVLGRALRGLLAWAWNHDSDADIRTSAGAHEAAARDITDRWHEAGRGARLPSARFPRTAARLAALHDALRADGYAAFWR